MVPETNAFTCHVQWRSHPKHQSSDAKEKQHEWGVGDWGRGIYFWFSRSPASTAKKTGQPRLSGFLRMMEWKETQMRKNFWFAARLAAH